MRHYLRFQIAPRGTDYLDIIAHFGHTRIMNAKEPTTVHDLEEIRCPNAHCSHHGKAEAEGGKFWLNQRTGKENIIIYKCAHCRKCFSERRGTVLFESRLPFKEVEAIIQHLREGCGLRRTARLTGHSRTTVSRYAHLAGLHAKAVHEQTVRGLECKELQVDEKWSFVGKKRN